MKVVNGIVEALAAAPVLALLAIALGPVTLAVLAIVGFGVAFFVVVDLIAGTAYVLERGAARVTHPH